MGEKSRLFIALSLVIFATTLTLAQEYSIDISGLSSEDYNPSEELSFKIILLEDTKEISQEVSYKLTDALHKKTVEGKATSNEEIILPIENDFPSGIWTIQANFNGKQVIRTFNVGENLEIEFLIEADNLIITNKGNTRYTKTIQITIGDKTSTYTQNIKAGDRKVLRLISEDGTYNIKVTDGTTTIKRENVQLFGVGNVVGAVDEELVGYTGFAGADNLRKAGDRTISLKKLPLSMIFIAAVGILAFLVIVERKMTKKSKK